MPQIYPAYIVSLLFFVGLLIRMPDIPNYWKWNVYINPLQWAPSIADPVYITSKTLKEPIKEYIL